MGYNKHKQFMEIVKVAETTTKKQSVQSQILSKMNESKCSKVLIEMF